MPVRIALFGRLNLGGINAVPMEGLRAVAEAAGCTAVRSHLASGNLVFQTGAARGKTGDAALADTLSAALAARFGIRVPVRLLAPEDLAATLAADPFPGANPSRVHLVFAFDPAAPLDPAPFAPRAARGERLSSAGPALALHAPEGIAGSRLAAALVRELPGTARTLGTARRLMADAAARGDA